MSAFLIPIKLLNGVAWERPFENLFTDEIILNIRMLLKAASELSHILKTTGSSSLLQVIRLQDYTQVMQSDMMQYIFILKKMRSISSRTHSERRKNRVSKREYMCRIEMFSGMQEKKKGY